MPGDSKIAFLRKADVLGECECKPDLWLALSAAPIGVVSVCWQMGHSHSSIGTTAVSLHCKLGLSKQATCMCSNARWLP